MGERTVPARGRGFLLALAAVVLAAATLAGPAQAITIPVGFDDQAVTILPRPTAMDWTPDGRMVITTHAGMVRIFKNGTLNSTAALDWRSNTCKDEEWGMLGVAVDPDFVVNNYVYIYYTAKKFGVCTKNAPDSPVNRVSRFVLGSNDLIDPGSETPIVDGIQDPDGIHAGGDVEFGPDGNLFISTGDGGCDFRGDSGCYPFNDAAQDLGVLSGKVLRVTKTGGIPLDNPYAIGPDTDQCSPTGYTLYSGICREIYSYGLRNPFRIAIDPNSASPLVRANDVGLNTWEEVNELSPGGNFGWNVREGNCVRDSSTDCGPPPAGMTNPIHSYNHNTGCVSNTASDFVPNGVWPAPYSGDYLFGDLVCQKVWRLEPDGSGGYTPTEFATGIPWLIDGVFGPDGASKAYYYISWVGFPNDVIRKIVFTGMSNHTPVASASANPTYGNVPLNVGFNGTNSSDSDNDPLTYDWDFGDGSQHSSSATPNHTYTTAGSYDAKLTVTDIHGADDTATVRITAGDFPPDVFIDAPFPGKLFKVGEQMTLVGSAEDPEEGPLPNSSLIWRVERHHDTHFHPYLPETAGNNIPIFGPEPEDLSAATNSYLEIILTATDSQGLSTTVTRNIQPKKVDISFDTIPAGLNVEVAGSTRTAFTTVTSWQDWGLIVNAPDQADSQGRWWVFDQWSDLGARTHTINTPGSPNTYTAIYKQLLYPRPGGASPLHVPLVPEYQRCDAPNTQHVAPLDSPSCTPAVLESPLLTTSTVGRGNSRARLDVMPGIVSTETDEADVRIRAMAADVLSNTTGTPDYTGNLILRTTMRITDRANGSSGAVPATSQDLQFSVPVNCVATATLGGSDCSIDTSSDALVPGFAREGKRAVISTLSMQMLDAGPDGLIAPSSDPFGLGCPPTCGSGDEQVFLRQGVFAP
jgi:glucose/arabinose dehydrogenase/PKD repeat protein